MRCVGRRKRLEKFQKPSEIITGIIFLQGKKCISEMLAISQAIQLFIKDKIIGFKISLAVYTESRITLLTCVNRIPVCSKRSHAVCSMLEVEVYLFSKPVFSFFLDLAYNRIILSASIAPQPYCTRNKCELKTRIKCIRFFGVVKNTIGSQELLWLQRSTSLICKKIVFHVRKLCCVESCHEESNNDITIFFGNGSSCSEGLWELKFPLRHLEPPRSGHASCS